MTETPPSVAERIAALARGRLGGSLGNLTRLTGGASQELWSFEVAGPDRIAEYVLRRSPDDDRIDRSGTVDLATEAAVIRAVAARGARVAPVVHVLEPGDGLGQGFVARRMPGEALGHRIVRADDFAAARRRLAEDCGAILAGIHATPLSALPTLPTLSPAAAIDRLERSLRRSGQARPVFEAALVWLGTHCPADVPVALVHGDFRTGNFLLTRAGISAVLDWEGCHFGDPSADLGWLCMPVWRFGRIGRPVGGFGDRADLYAAYEAAGGAPVEPTRVRFWEVYGMLRWGLTCVGMAAAVARGERSVERAAVGRRACEAELELLHALAPTGRPNA